MISDRAVFISYARKDLPRVERKVTLLRAGGVAVVMDVLDIEPGDKWEEGLRVALERCDRVLVYWSKAPRVSDWVMQEWRAALALGKRVVPTLLDRTPLPKELRQFQAINRFRRVELARWWLLMAVAPILVVVGLLVWNAYRPPDRNSLPQGFQDPAWVVQRRQLEDQLRLMGQERARLNAVPRPLARADEQRIAQLQEEEAEVLSRLEKAPSLRDLPARNFLPDWLEALSDMLVLFSVVSAASWLVLTFGEFGAGEQSFCF